MRQTLFFMLLLLQGLVQPVTVVAAAPSPDWSPASVLRTLAEHRQGEVRFTEQKFIGVLDTPLLSEGTLTFRPPDYLEKHTTSPRDERMTIEGDVLTYTRQSQTYTLNLAEHPEATAYANSIRGLLNGNAALLRKSYVLKLSGDRAHWVLLLLPTDPRIQSLIKSISVNGSGDHLQRIEYDQANGDRSVMTLLPAIPPTP
jgi:outer membrane lipoprotein-sorting protein